MAEERDHGTRIADGVGRTRPVRIAIIGAGVRGLAVLERIRSHAVALGEQLPIAVHLVEPSRVGPEQYKSGAPDFLLLNIIAGQVSMFPSETSLGLPQRLKGPSLREWASERGYRLSEDGFTVSDVGREIGDGDFLPRRLMGEYLGWFKSRVLDAMPPWVDIAEHWCEARDLATRSDGVVLTLADDTELSVDYAFLTIGHPRLSQEESGAPLPSHRTIRDPYPLPAQIGTIDGSETVAVEGLGLTAIDAILSLTVGHIGRFERTAEGLSYRSSGYEPGILAYSGSGLPYRARPAIHGAIAYEPVVFTRASVDQLRASERRLDYDEHVLPLILTELRVAYRRAAAEIDGGPRSASRLLAECRKRENQGSLGEWLDVLDDEEGHFDARTVYFGEELVGDHPALASSSSYAHWFYSFVLNDLREAQHGVGRSALKTAIEILREFRDTIRYAVDFGGINEASHARFFSVHATAINRLVVGPQKERAQELLALLDAGVLTIDLGPGPIVEWDESRHCFRASSTRLLEQAHREFDWVYHARVPRPTSLETAGGIIGALARSGEIRNFASKMSFPAIEHSHESMVVRADGKANRRVFILGPMTEGVTFYNTYLTSPNRLTRCHTDADRAVASVVADVRRRGASETVTVAAG